MKAKGENAKQQTYNHFGMIQTLHHLDRNFIYLVQCSSFPASFDKIPLQRTFQIGWDVNSSLDDLAMYISMELIVLM